MKSIGEIRFIEGNKEVLENIKPLWEKLNEFHMEKSVHFKEKFSKLSFEQRIIVLLEKAKEGRLVVYLAYDDEKAVGYCVSTIDAKNVGEIESLYVEEEYRGSNIGDYFMKKSLNWMEEYKVKEKRIGVAAGNESAFTFYERYGFYTKATVLSQI